MKDELRSDIKVPMVIELRAGDVVVAVIENDPALFSLVLQHAVAYDRKAKFDAIQAKEAK